MRIDGLTEREFFDWYALYSEYAAGEGVVPSDEQVMRTWTALQEPGALGVVAHDDDGTVVGFAHAVPFERLLGGGGLQLEDVYVAPSSRRRGVAGALVEHVAGRAGQGALRWEARPQDPAAQALSQRLAGAGRVLQRTTAG